MKVGYCVRNWFVTLLIWTSAGGKNQDEAESVDKAKESYDL
jgi:hypothetical protein